MINVRLSKHKVIAKVLRDVSKEVMAVVNKTTRRGNERRVLRVELDNVIATSLENKIDTNRGLVLGSEIDFGNRGHMLARNASSTVDTGIRQACGRLYEGDILNDDPLPYDEEVVALLKTLETATELALKDDAEVVMQIMADTKSVAGRVTNHWSQSGGAIQFFSGSDLVKCVGGSDGRVLLSGTCGEIVKLADEWNVFHKAGRGRRGSDDKVTAPEKTLAWGCFWYCKEDGKFFNIDDIRSKENAKKTIVAYESKPDNSEF